MICKVDNKIIFKDKTFYCIKCEICDLNVKVYHYRSCEDRIKANLEQGNDILKPLREANKIFSQQLGIPVSDPGEQFKPEQKPSNSPSNKRRGR